MKTIRDAYSGLLSLFNYPYIPEELLNNLKGPILMHISDTTTDIYNYIFRVINILKPQYIVHTGDMADNIKLEKYKNRLHMYQEGVTKLIEGLEKDEQTKVYYVLGNHDDYDTVNELTKRGTILQDGLIEINDCSITVSHYHKDNSLSADFNLYGHSFKPGHYKEKETMNLNGLLNINIIDLSNKNAFHLQYPVGTNISRRMELKKIGI